jgi:hypothetical protein
LRPPWPSSIDANPTAVKTNGWGIFNAKNDLWIGAATKVSGATLLTMDKDFQPFRDGKHLAVTLIDAKSGWTIS